MVLMWLIRPTLLEIYMRSLVMRKPGKNESEHEDFHRKDLSYKQNNMQNLFHLLIFNSVVDYLGRLSAIEIYIFWIF